MPFSGVWTTLRRGITVIAALQVLALTPFPSLHGQATEEATAETRALWVLRTSMSSPESIAALVSTARGSGFNTLFVQVRGRGDAYFNGGIEPRAADLNRQPAAFDPLATVLTAARGAGLRVHAWVNVNLVSSAVDLPIATSHIVQRHPDWLMVPRDLAQELARIQEESPAYVGRIARWTRSQPTGVEGLYVSPILPAAVAHIDAVVRDLVTRYAVDGIHLDYARYPSARFDYSRSAIREFRAAVRPGLPAAVRQDVDARERNDPLAYPDTFQDEWKAFRTARMTAVISRLRATIKGVRDKAIVSVATAPDLEEARDQKFQDWGAWLQAGLVDAVCPMAYTPEPVRFAEQIGAALNIPGSGLVWAGIGAYRLPAAQTIENIRTARRLGAAGVALFSYDSLVDPRQAAPDYIAVVGRTAFAAPAAASDAAR
jgi:uncharacterized lipoprotein YddW (UPF0748 family)